MNFHRHEFEILSYNKEGNPRYYCCKTCPLIIKEELVKSANPKGYSTVKVTVVRNIDH